MLMAVRTLTIEYEKNMRVWNISCGCMRASTVGCRVSDRCGDGVTAVKPGEGEGVYVAGVSGVRHLLMCVTFYIIFA